MLVGYFSTSLLFCCPDPAPAAPVTNDLSAWQTVQLDLSVAPHLQFNDLIQQRENKRVSKADAFFEFADLTYYPHKDNTGLGVGAGYAWVGRFQPKFTNENWIYEQLIYTGVVCGGTLLLRERLVQRFIPNIIGVSAMNWFKARYAHPFYTGSPWYWTVADEFFVNLNMPTRGPHKGVNQNRMYLAVGRTLGKHFRLEAGYLLQLQHQPDHLNHALITELVIH